MKEFALFAFIGTLVGSLIGAGAICQTFREYVELSKLKQEVGFAQYQCVDIQHVSFDNQDYVLCKEQENNDK